MEQLTLLILYYYSGGEYETRLGGKQAGYATGFMELRELAVNCD